ELVNGNLDWDYVYKLARRHSLVPLVYSQLERSVKEFVPPEVLQRFRKNYQENAARNLIFADELTSLLKAFADVDIDAIVFKGPALAVSAYGDLALRRFVDLDVMVRRADVARAIEVMSVKGYAPARPLNPEQQALLLRTQHNLQFTRGRLIVELHWQVSPELFASSVTAEELWQNLETVPVNKTEVKTLATEDLLFSLCVHGSRHLWQRLAWICDIDRIIATRTNIDWSRLLDRAQEAKAERMFLLGPALAARLLGTRLPDSVAEAIARDRQIGAIAGEINARLFDGTEQQPHSLGTIFHYNYRIRSDWRSRMRYCRHMLAPTDSDLESVRLSKPLHFVYYLLRPLRLLRN
ncbi:MAG TPA: nucleotidyltransferase family protein, partial [Pyrinomonadaceae bacterium]